MQRATEAELRAASLAQVVETLISIAVQTTEDEMPRVSDLGLVPGTGFSPAPGMEPDEWAYREPGLLGTSTSTGSSEEPDTLVLVTNLALLLSEQSELDEQEPLYREALEVRRRILGENHPATISSRNALAALQEGAGMREAAEQQYREALARGRRALGDDHAEVLRSLSGLCSVLRACGRGDEVGPEVRGFLDSSSLVDDHPARAGFRELLTPSGGG